MKATRLSKTLEIDCGFHSYGLGVIKLVLKAWSVYIFTMQDYKL